MSLKTTYTKAPEISRKWHVIDAQGKALGRISAVAAQILQGKHKPTFTPHVDDGDFVVIINAYQFTLSGRKENTKVYRRHTGWMGGLRELSHRQMMEKKPWFPLEKAIRAMLPKNRLARRMFKKLIIVEGSEFKNANSGLIIHRDI